VLFALLLAPLAHGVALPHLDPVRVVNQTVEYAIRQRGIANLLVPAADRQLRGENCRMGFDTALRVSRGLGKTVIRTFAQESIWVSKHENVFVLGPTGVGNSFLASALAQKACRDGYLVFYARAQSLFRDLGLACIQSVQTRSFRHGHLMVVPEVIDLSFHTTFFMAFRGIPKLAGKPQCERKAMNFSVSSRR